MKKQFFIIILFSTFCFNCIRNTPASTLEEVKNNIPNDVLIFEDEELTSDLDDSKIETDTIDKISINIIDIKTGRKISLKKEVALFFGKDSLFFDDGIPINQISSIEKNKEILVQLRLVTKN